MVKPVDLILLRQKIFGVERGQSRGSIVNIKVSLSSSGTKNSKSREAKNERFLSQWWITVVDMSKLTDKKL